MRHPGFQAAVAALAIALAAASCNSHKGGAGAKAAGRRALLIGVGKYANHDIPQLAGPKNDVRAMKELLTKTFQFPQSQVAVLLDEKATVQGVKDALARLTDSAQKDDQVVLYYSGHGSRVQDVNGDEPDGWDETLVLHDSRTGSVEDLDDDTLNELLRRLYAKTENVLFIADSCHSGSVTRDGSAGIARLVPPPKGSSGVGRTVEVEKSDTSRSMPNLTFFSAAEDGTVAMEVGGRGVFTDALVQVLSQPTARPLTYGQLKVQVPARMKEVTAQVPFLEGRLDREVFGGVLGLPPTWRVDEVDAAKGTVKLSGPPLPGMGKAAELRIFPGNATAETLRSGAAKAVVELSSYQGLTAGGEIKPVANANGVVSQEAAGKAIQVGDLAVLAQESDESLRVAVRLRAPGQAGGVPAAAASQIRQRIAGDEDAKLAVVLVDRKEDFEIAANGSGFDVVDPQRRVRNTAVPLGALPKLLWAHARQRALRALIGNGAGVYRDDDTIQVRLRPDDVQSACADTRAWVQAQPGSPQVIPLCVTWNIEVKVKQGVPGPLRIGGVYLSSDGSIEAFPEDGTSFSVPADGQWKEVPDFKIRAAPPLESVDYLRVFGTQASNAVDWAGLRLSASEIIDRATRSGSSLEAALAGSLQPGVRGGVREKRKPLDATAWTATTLPTYVEANASFKRVDTDEKISAANRDAAVREYTIAGFRIAPYLPDDRATALYKVLTKADELVNLRPVIGGKAKGVPYKQHDWSKPTDAENLALGIDCSRFMWFVFTRSGLPYTGAASIAAQYLSTKGMVAADSPLSQRFDKCDTASIQLGDILVYRDEHQGDGHTVMVIDPDKRIAVGSHGWDGNAKENPKLEPETGVEYQLIKYKPDWKRWDRSSMELAGCWRYRKFVEEARQGNGVPGGDAVAKACGEQRCRTVGRTGPPPSRP